GRAKLVPDVRAFPRAVGEFESHVPVQVPADFRKVAPGAAQLEAAGDGAAYVFLLEHCTCERREADAFHLLVDGDRGLCARGVDAYVAGVGAVEELRRDRVQAHLAIRTVHAELQVLEQHAGQCRTFERYPAARLQRPDHVDGNLDVVGAAFLLCRGFLPGSHVSVDIYAV